MVVLTNKPVCCAISDLLTPLPDDAGQAGRPEISAITERLRSLLRRWAREGVNLVQIREKELPAGELLQMTRAAVEELDAVAASGPGALRPKLLVNGRSDIAAAAGADGVHLTARDGELSPAQVHRLYVAAGRPSCTVSVSCHTLAEVAHAVGDGADLILFGPVLEKRLGTGEVLRGVGLEALRAACVAAGGTPVLALGGVAAADWEALRHAGAAGIAGIRLFR